MKKIISKHVLVHTWINRQVINKSQQRTQYILYCNSVQDYVVSRGGGGGGIPGLCRAAVMLVVSFRGKGFGIV